MVFIHLARVVFDGLKGYFENTTVHGFQYIVASKRKAAKLFWIASIVLAFSFCSVLLLRSLQEARDNPILTINEEIDLKDMPLPAFSLLAPKELASFGFKRSMLNRIDACDPNIVLDDSAPFHNIKGLMTLVNNKIRKITKENLGLRATQYKDTEVSDDLFQVDDNLRLFHAMAEKYNNSLLTDMIDQRLDKFYLVTDLESVMGKLSKEWNVDIGTVPINITDALFERWITVSSPIWFRNWLQLGCAEE